MISCQSSEPPTIGKILHHGQMSPSANGVRLVLDYERAALDETAERLRALAGGISVGAE
jgi:hypothetical protein